MAPPDLPTVDDFDWGELEGPRGSARPPRAPVEAPPLPPPPRAPSGSVAVPIPPRDRPSSLVSATAKWKARQSEIPGRFNLASELLDGPDLALLDRVAQPPAPFVTEEPSTGTEIGGTVLVVDPDGQARRFVEVAVNAQRLPDLKVMTAMDASSALAIMAERPVHLVISESDLPDGSGMVLFSQLSQEKRLDGIPFVILTSDDRVENKILALRAGIADYLVKPVEQAELGARCVAMVARARAQQAQARKRSYMLAGDFSALPFPDLMVMLELSRVTGTLSIMTRQANATILLSEGRAMHGVYGTVVGDDAVYRLMADGSGRFEFSPGRCDVSDEGVTITQSITGLVMEGARRLDEGEIERSPGSRQEAPTRATNPGFAPLVAAALSPEAAASFAASPLVDGVLHVFDSRSLGTWTTEERPATRVHVLLVADPVEAIAALVPFARPVSSEAVIGALSQEPKTVGLAFDFETGERLDVVLIDARAPGAFAPSLLRAPALVILAPPGGDLLSLGLSARSDLDVLLSNLRPLAVLGVGSDRLPQLFTELWAARDEKMVVSMQTGRLSTTPLDGLLTKGLTLLAGR